MRVEHPSFTFGIAFEQRNETWLAIEAAPLAYSLLDGAKAGRDWDSVRDFFAGRGARVTELPDGSPLTAVCLPGKG